METKRQISSGLFNPENCFVAENENQIIGSIAVTKLPRDGWFVLRYLALEEGTTNDDLGRRLVQTAVESAKSQNAEYLRSTTPLVEPYISIYLQEGFRPVRRDLRIHWKLPVSDVSTKEDKKIKLRDVTEDDEVDLASDVFMKSIEDIWTWRTTEQGGPENVMRNFKGSFFFGKNQKWKLVFDQNEIIIGLTGLMPNDGGPGKGRFRGAYVLPEHRGFGYGMAIMQAVFEWAMDLGQNEMVIYTFSPLDKLAPGAALYLKSGGKVDSEYLQLEKDVT